MSIRIRATALLWLAAATTAPCASAQEADQAEPAPPVIEIVDDGGVAGTWRAEGGAFAAYGPEGEAAAPTLQAQALQALNASYDVRFVARDGDAVRASVPVASAAQSALARRILDDWLRASGAAPSGCVPAFAHALAFAADGHAWEARLDYGCRRYSLRKDGAEVAAGVTADAAGRAEFDAVLATAGAGEG